MSTITELYTGANKSFVALRDAAKVIAPRPENLDASLNTLEKQVQDAGIEDTSLNDLIQSAKAAVANIQKSLGDVKKFFVGNVKAGLEQLAQKSPELELSFDAETSSAKNVDGPSHGKKFEQVTDLSQANHNMFIDFSKLDTHFRKVFKPVHDAFANQLSNLHKGLENQGDKISKSTKKFFEMLEGQLLTKSNELMSGIDLQLKSLLQTRDAIFNKLVEHGTWSPNAGALTFGADGEPCLFGYSLALGPEGSNVPKPN